uniref:Cytochrome c oxidase subunit 3 n=1 Tax=Tigriopus californicus TaxID=6832 RepID=A2T5A2_TIGCA|nr:cytochrome c oxidase subunit III [Tigriopus californicus]
MSNFVRHPYHLVDESPWPLLAAAGGLFITSGMLKGFAQGEWVLFFLGGAHVWLLSGLWWNDMSKKGGVQGLHTFVVQTGLRWGMALLMVSEAFFFLSFFGTFSMGSLSPAIEIGGAWPPLGVLVFSPWEVPLLNTIVLLSSGLTVTWAHHAVQSGELGEALLGLGSTLVLGGYFTCLQGFEYWEASFSFADSVYGSSFYIATGFHGIHVIVGSLFLLVSLFRLKQCSFSASHHVGLEAGIWYWHFVDVVWLFLYLVVYWWGNSVN